MEFTLKNLLEWILKGIVFIIVISILFGAGAFCYTKFFVSPTYSTSVKFYASGTAADMVLAGAYQSAAPQYVEFLNVREFSEKVSKSLLDDTGKELSPKAIEASLSFSNVVEETASFFAMVTTTDADLTYHIAVAVAKAAPDQIKEICKDGDLIVIENPTKPTAPSSPGPMHNTVLGFLAGFVLSAIAVVLKEALDTRIDNVDEITELFGLPVLGVVPDFSAGARKEVSK